MHGLIGRVRDHGVRPERGVLAKARERLRGVGRRVIRRPEAGHRLTERADAGRRRRGGLTDDAHGGLVGVEEDRAVVARDAEDGPQNVRDREHGVRRDGADLFRPGSPVLLVAEELQREVRRRAACVHECDVGLVGRAVRALNMRARRQEPDPRVPIESRADSEDSPRIVRRLVDDRGVRRDAGSAGRRRDDERHVHGAVRRPEFRDDTGDLPHLEGKKVVAMGAEERPARGIEHEVHVSGRLGGVRDDGVRPERPVLPEADEDLRRGGGHEVVRGERRYSLSERAATRGRRRGGLAHDLEEVRVGVNPDGAVAARDAEEGIEDVGVRDGSARPDGARHLGSGRSVLIVAEELDLEVRVEGTRVRDGEARRVGGAVQSRDPRARREDVRRRERRRPEEPADVPEGRERRVHVRIEVARDVRLHQEVR